MFEVTADGAVFHFDRPVILFIYIVGWLAEARHRLNADGVTFDELVAVAFFAIIRNLGSFVHTNVDAVADVIFDHAEVALS